MPAPTASRPLRGTRIVSLALNLPGPAALMRLRALGARCLKVEPPGPTLASGRTLPGDPMGAHSNGAYSQMHTGVRTITLDLKTERDRQRLARELAQSEVLLTSFRPSALARLGLDWRTLQRAHPHLSLVEIVGAPGERAEEPGHDLTYLAEAGLVTGTELPPTLLADMAGALLAVEATLTALMPARAGGKGVRREVALSEAARWLALPRGWGLTTADGVVGGAHAGYRVYPCKDGRIALAALEPHFFQRLAHLAGLQAIDHQTPFAPATHSAVAAWIAGKTRRQMDALALRHDIPLFTLAR